MLNESLTHENLQVFGSRVLEVLGTEGADDGHEAGNLLRQLLQAREFGLADGEQVVVDEVADLRVGLILVLVHNNLHGHIAGLVVHDAEKSGRTAHSLLSLVQVYWHDGLLNLKYTHTNMMACSLYTDN